MKLFAELYFALDMTSDPCVRIRALAHYLRQTQPEDAIRALNLLLGTRPRRVLPLEELQQLALETAKVPRWLFEESLAAVKDKLETVTLLLPPADAPKERSLIFWLDDILPTLRDGEVEQRNAEICSSWKQMDFQERFVWNKLLSGGFRLQLPDSVIVEALSDVSGLDAYVLAYRLKHIHEKHSETYHALIAPDITDAAAGRPYPFSSWQMLDKHLTQSDSTDMDSHPHLHADKTLRGNDNTDWHIEWDWDGLRVQCIKRQGQFFIWSQNTVLLTDKFPELHEFGQSLSDGTVIEAQLVAWQEDSALSEDVLQTRIRRKHLTKKLLQETPLRVFAFDVLEDEGQDIRKQAFSLRRDRLSALLRDEPTSCFYLSPAVHAACWAELDSLAEQARKKGAAGLKLIPGEPGEESSGNLAGWWIWEAQPFTMLGVLLYVQRRQGQSLISINEYSFAVWDGKQLIKVATAEGKFSQEEQEEIDRFVKENTLERFGPVRSLKAELVFELSFEGIRKSARHKAGLKLDNPKIIRWRREKSREDADTLSALQALVCE